MFTRRFTASVARTSLTAAALGLAALGFAGTAGASSVDDAPLAIAVSNVRSAASRWRTRVQ